MSGPNVAAATVPQPEEQLKKTRLETFLCAQAGAQRVTLEHQQRLSGGAIQENWLLDVSVEGGAVCGSPALGPAQRRTVGGTGQPQPRAGIRGVEHGPPGRRQGAPDHSGCAKTPRCTGGHFSSWSGCPASPPATGSPASWALKAIRSWWLTWAPTWRASIASCLARPDWISLATRSRYRCKLRLMPTRGVLDRLEVSQPVLEWGLRWCEVKRAENFRPVFAPW